MFGKNILQLSLLSFVLLIGCAQPKYETITQNPRGTSPNEKVTSCEIAFRQSSYCLLWQWEAMPTSSKSGTIVFKVVRANLLDGTAVPVEIPNALELNLWMPSMGHGSTPTQILKVDTGSYRANNVYFVMPGDWELKFQIKEGSTVLDEAVVSLTI